MAAKKQSSASSGTGHQGDWPFLPPGTARQILLLRWLALLLVVALHWFDRSTEGVIFPLPQMAVAVVVYNGLLLMLMRFVPWLRRPLNYLAVDTVVATLTVFLTGGYHSSFFVLYIFITIGAAFFLELVPTVVVTLGIGLIYVGACYVNPAGLQVPVAQYIMAAKLLGFLVVSVLCGLLLEQLRREHRETERERALAQRLKALNDLFQLLSTTLDVERTLETVARAPTTLLGADLTTIALLDEDGRHLSVVAAVGIDVTLLADQRWTLDDPLISAVLASGEPTIVDQPERYVKGLPASLADHPALQAIRLVVTVPLTLNDEPLGVLDVAFGEVDVFAEDDLAFLRALGREAALAIRNAHLYEREREQVARLRALDRLQEGFVSAVSHELRTPLTCIRTSVDLLQVTSSGFSEDQVDLISTVGQHVGRLEALVGDLLEVTKLEAGQVTLSTQPTDLRRLVGRVVESLQPLTDRKGLTVRTHLPEAASAVDVDRRRIEQVVTNVLHNAYKFTPKGGRVEIRLTEASGSVRICVTDSGTGIPEKDQARVFDRFYVVDDGRGLSGVGLGLFIAQQMVELHGGRIWVESRPGAGSTFCFSLPVAVPEEER